MSEHVFTERIPGDRTDASTAPTLFASDAGVEGVLRAAGPAEVHSVGASYRVPFLDVEQWRAFSMGTGMRPLWRLTGPEQHADIMEEVARPLAGHEHTLDVAMRYTLGVRPG